MEFKGSIKVSRYKVDDACVNFKKIHNEVMRLIREKKEDLKTTITPVYFFGIKVPYLKSTKYEDLGFNGGALDAYFALESMVEVMVVDQPDGPVKNLLEMYCTDSFSTFVNCYHQLNDLRNMATDDVTVNPSQAKFIHEYCNV